MSLLRALIAAVCVSLLPCAPAIAAVDPPVELISNTPLLQPSSTLEFRFAQPIVSREEVGLSPRQSPIVIDPRVPGTFTWLSRSSGVFVPEGPWPLGAAYKVSLRPGLTGADGKPLPGDFRRDLHTPPFGQTAQRGVGDPEDAPAKPEVVLAFNLPVELKGASDLFLFIDEHGRRIPATVRYGTRRDYLPLRPEQEDWQKRWQLARGEAPDASEEEEEMEADVEDEALPPLPNRLVITPAEALTPSARWRMEMRPGLQATTGKYRIAERFELPIGLVQPFEIESVTPSSYVNSGRSVILEFSHAMAPDITPETAAKFFRIEPAVPEMQFEGWDTSLTIRGKFERDQEYRLIVDPAVISAAGLPLEGERTRTFRFGYVAPRLYLPEITAHQIRGGQRKFEVMSVNMKSLRVVARLVPPAEAAQAVQAFGKYEEAGEDDETYKRLPDGTIRGKVIYDRVMEMPAPAPDTRQQTVLQWDEIAGAQRAGAIFLTVEGEPLAEVEGRRAGAQALIQLTDLGILWKKVEEGLRVMVFSMASGTPVSGARVSLLNSEFKSLRSSATDAQGFALIPIGPDPGWLVVSKGDDAHALRMGNEASELPMAAFRLPMEYGSWEGPTDGQLPQLRGMIFTDRPLYRPGEAVKVKGIIRSIAGTGMAPVGQVNGVLKLRNPRGDDESEVQVTTDERGAFDAEIMLGGGKTGHYSVQLSFPEAPEMRWQRGFSCGFEVADFQPNAFELDLAVPPRLAPGTDVRAQLSAKYFFGTPLGEASARWTLRYVQEAFSPEGFANWQFGSDDGPAEKSLTLSGQGTLAGAKGFTIQPQLPAPKSNPARGVLTAEVTDINQQTVSESRMFTRDASDFYLGLAMQEGTVFRAGEKVVGRAIAVRPDGQPLPQPVELNAELIHVRFNTVRVQGAGKAVSFRTDKTETVVGRSTGRTLIPVRKGESWQVDSGESVSFPVATAGQYRLRITAKDSAGREVTSTLPLYVSGSEETSWEYRNPQQVELVPDKQDYRGGDTARILVKTPISGEAWVTVEREQRILRSMRVRLEGNAPAIEIPIESTDAPNVFVSVVLIRGLDQSTRKFKTVEYRYGATMLSVSDPTTRLQVEVAPAAPHVEPRTELETEIRVRNGAGAAVADAEVTFFAVDDGILALTGYERPMPGPIFDAPFPLSVRTGLTLYELMPEDPAALEFSNKGYLIGGGGLEGPGLKLRRDFPGTACWMPALRTDREGKVRVRFRVPDALTRYRLVAVAHAGTNLFGSGESSFSIRQPLMLMPALAQFANYGDQIAARAVIHNETGADGVAEVALALDKMAEPVNKEAGALSARVNLRNGEMRAVDFPVRLRAIGNAEWKWSAQMPSPGRVFRDDVASSLSVGSAAPVLRETYLPDLTAGDTDLLKGINPQLLEGTGAAAVTVSNTRLSSLKESAAHLLHYPYGCGEQTVSSLIPWVLLPQLGPVMPGLVKNGDEAPGVISAGIDRLFAMQTPAGGIAMWPGGREPSLFISAYAALACSIAQKQEVAPHSGHDELLKYLSGELRGIATVRDEHMLGDRALVLWALASSGHAEPAYHEELFRRRKELSYESRALLALAILEAQGPPTMIEDLLNPRLSAPEAVSWFGSAARERAIQLLAWVQYKPKAAEVGRLVKELLSHRARGHWGTTQSNAWALLALARYYTAVEGGVPKPVSGALVTTSGEHAFQVTRQAPAAVRVFPLTPEEPLQQLVVKNPRKGNLFGEATFIVRPLVTEQPRQDRGYAVSRNYRKLADDGSLQEASDLKVGDRMLVTLRVETARPGHFVAIDDPLPAILEAVNPTFQSKAVAGGEGLAQDGRSDFREIRKDRVLYFCDHLPAGAYTFRYLARVRAAGAVTAGPTKAEEMYRPERFGLSESIRLEARAADVK